MDTFFFFQNHKTFYFVFGSKMVFAGKKKTNTVATPGGVLCHEKYNIYMWMAKRKG